MTELQKAFLLITLAYYLVKGGLYVALYVATVIVEKRARERQAIVRAYLKKKRTEEAQRWKVAYELYYEKGRKYRAQKIELDKAS